MKDANKSDRNDLPKSYFVILCLTGLHAIGGGVAAYLLLTKLLAPNVAFAQFGFLKWLQIVEVSFAPLLHLAFFLLMYKRQRKALPILFTYFGLLLIGTLATLVNSYQSDLLQPALLGGLVIGAFLYSWILIKVRKFHCCPVKI